MILSTDKRVRERSMSQKLLLMVLPLVLILGTMAGCEGPAGSEGPQGPQGEQGAVGPAGEDGSVMHAGKGAPEKDVGVNGDFYLNRNTGELYGPKNDKGWGTPISLQGPPGQDGKDGEAGSQIHSGTGAPATSLGANGDYYLDKASFELYGPKTGSGWGNPISLKGTANVLYSSWVDIAGNSGEWKPKEFFNDSLRYHDIAANTLTQDIVDKGVVNVYADLRHISSEVDHIYSLPMPGLPGIGVSFYFEYKAQNVRIAYFDPNDPASDAGDLTVNTKFRYVIIPGGVAAKSKLSKDQIKKMSYQEVKQRFGIRN